MKLSHLWQHGNWELLLVSRNRRMKIGSRPQTGRIVLVLVFLALFRNLERLYPSNCRRVRVSNPAFFVTSPDAFASSAAQTKHE